MGEQYTEEGSCSLGYFRFLWQVSSLFCSCFHTNETRRLPSALPATPGGCELKAAVSMDFLCKVESALQMRGGIFRVCCCVLFACRFQWH